MAITKSKLDLSEVNGFSGLLKAYISADPSLKPLYAQEPTVAGFEQLLKTRPYEKLDRNLLADSLILQYKKAMLSPGEQTASNIEKLRNRNTYTICTGHQLCLFTGPLYFIYKIISAVNLAQALKEKHPDCDFVPVYWMATEDHDFDEINHVQLFGKTYTWTKELALGSETITMPGGKVPTASLSSLLAEIEQVLGVSGFASDLTSLIRKAYEGHANLADATRCFTDSLLGHYGLVIVDGSDTALKSSFIPYMQEELESRPNYPLVRQGIAALSALGYEAQVNPREINLFYMKDDLRARIELDSASSEYLVVGTSIRFSRETILQELREYPLRFSPNVVLRPLYQQIILPNIAYVGGPGELAYWLEFKPMFDRHNALFPILMPRNFVLWLDQGSASRLEKLGIGIPELSGQLAELEKTYVSSRISDGLKLDQEANKLKEIFEAIIAKVSQADSTLKAPADAEMQKALGGLKNLESKVARAEKLKHETALGQLRTLKEKLFPGGNLQERVDSFMPIYLKHGKTFIETLKTGLDPFERSLIVFTEKPE